MALTRPFAYDEYRAQRILEKVEAERQSRIGVVRKLPKVWPDCLPAAQCIPMSVELLQLPSQPHERLVLRHHFRASSSMTTHSCEQSLPPSAWLFAKICHAS